MDWGEIAAVLLGLWGIGALVVLGWSARCSSGWAEHALAATVALFWPALVLTLGAVMLADWRRSRSVEELR